MKESLQEFCEGMIMQGFLRNGLRCRDYFCEDAEKGVLNMEFYIFPPSAPDFQDSWYQPHSRNFDNLARFSNEEYRAFWEGRGEVKTSSGTFKKIYEKTLPCNPDGFCRRGVSYRLAA